MYNYKRNVFFISFTSRGSTAEETTQNIIDEQIPSISSLCETGEIHVDNIDVFCEKGVFNTEQSRRILLAGKNCGWKINFHGDEINPMNSGEVRGKSNTKRLCENFKKNRMIIIYHFS